jgi:hypothetical protein
MLTPEEQILMKKIGAEGGRIGGKSKSEAKRKASRENLKKAMEARKELLESKE